MIHRRSPLRLVRLGVFCTLAVATLPRTGLADDPAPEGAVVWRTDYGAAMAEARDSDRLLWIQFTGHWCPNCLRMERESFTNSAIAARSSSDFVAVKLQADENQELALNFELSGLPASVIVDPSLKVLAVHQGYLAPEELRGLLEQTVAARAPKINAEDLAEAPRLASEFVGPPAITSRPAAVLEKTVKREEHAALSGYCPVSLIAEKKLVEGQAEYTVSHQGRVYRFANLVTFNRFRRDPDRYVPANDGRCPVEQRENGEAVAGDPRFGALFNGRLYLCASVEDRSRFLQEPKRYATVGVEEEGNCPHCLAERGEAVPGDPRYSLSQGDRRYWFPDDSHRSAFMSLAPSSTFRR